MTNDKFTFLPSYIKLWVKMIHYTKQYVQEKYAILDSRINS